MGEEDEGKRQILCEYCGGKATHETVTNNIYVCDDDACILHYAMDECLIEEITEEDHQEYGSLIDEDVVDVF